MNAAKQFELDQIKNQYRVPAEIGGRVKFQGKLGTIKGTRGPHLKVLLDGDIKPVNCHPTWKMEYLGD